MAQWLNDNRRPKSQRFICSECSEVAYYPQNHHSRDKERIIPYRFCPWCGAKMDGERNEE